MAVQQILLTGSAVQGIEPVSHEAKMMVRTMPATVHLGRRRPAALPQTLRFSAYLTSKAAAVAPPVSINRRDKAATSLARMYLNDQLGCCVIAGKAHALGLWSANDSPVTVLASDQEILSQYHSICGPGDNGCIISDVLDVMRAQGFLAGGQRYKIDGYVAVDWTNKLEVQIIQFLFGATTIGINLPQAWTQNAIWDVTSSQIIGGHDVTPLDYDEQGVYVASWGRVYLITWRAFLSRTWLEEYYALLAPLWYGNDMLAPCGVDADTLRADLTKLGGGMLPPLPDPGPMPPVPPVPPAPPPTPVAGPTLQQVTACDEDVFSRLQTAFRRVRGASSVLDTARIVLEKEHASLWNPSAPRLTFSQETEPYSEIAAGLAKLLGL